MLVLLSRCGWVLLLGLLAANSYAEKNIDLFSTDALVVNQTAEVRQQAAARGLATVLTRMSGSQSVLQNEAVQSALKKATAYLYQFSYQSTKATITLAGAEQPATRLVMHFSQAPLEKLLRDQGLPLWSSNRPDVLIWTARNDDKQRYVSAESFLGRALKSSALDRGLPVVTPILDLEDRSALPVARLWAMDEGSIRVAARRYDVDAVLAGRFREDGKRWAGNFMLLHQGKTHYLTAEGDSQSRVADSLIDQLTDFFADIYAVRSGGQGEQPVMLQVNNVPDFATFAQVTQYLEKLPLVTTVTVSDISSSQLTASLVLTTDVDQFLQTLALDKKLVRVNSSSTVSALSVSLNPSAPANQPSVPPQSALPAVPSTTVASVPRLEFLWQ